MIPKGWADAPLSDLGGEVKDSLSPRAGKTYELYSVPCFPTGRPEHLDGSQIKSGKRPVLPGDLLICKINPRINRVWLVAEPGGVGPQIASTEYLILRTGDPGLSRYLMWYLRSPEFRGWIQLAVEGATGSHTRAKSGPILRQRMPLPPASEQRRIVEAIEEQFSRLDAAETSLLRSQRNLARFRRASLASLFSDDWQARALSELTDPERVICYGILKPKTTGNLRVPYVEVRSIVDGSLEAAALPGTTWDLHRQFLRSELHAGDVVMAIRGSFDRAAVVSVDIEGGNVSRDVARIAPLPAVLVSDYLALYLSSPKALRFFSHHARGVAVKGVNIADLRRMPIPVPSIEEQRKAVAAHDRDFSVIRTIEAEVASDLERVRTLRKVLLREAFAGRLVHRDIPGRPASPVLEKVEA